MSKKNPTPAERAANLARNVADNPRVQEATKSVRSKIQEVKRGFESATSDKRKGTGGRKAKKFTGSKILKNPTVKKILGDGRSPKSVRSRAKKLGAQVKSGVATARETVTPIAKEALEKTTKAIETAKDFDFKGAKQKGAAKVSAAIDTAKDAAQVQGRAGPNPPLSVRAKNVGTSLGAKVTAAKDKVSTFLGASPTAQKVKGVTTSLGAKATEAAEKLTSSKGAQTARNVAADVASTVKQSKAGQAVSGAVDSAVDAAKRTVNNASVRAVNKNFTGPNKPSGGPQPPTAAQRRAAADEVIKTKKPDVNAGVKQKLKAAALKSANKAVNKTVSGVKKAATGTASSVRSTATRGVNLARRTGRALAPAATFAAKYVPPVAAVAGAVESLNKPGHENTVEDYASALARGVVDIVDIPADILAQLNVGGGARFKPGNTAIDALQAAGTGVGTFAADIGAGKDFGESVRTGFGAGSRDFDARQERTFSTGDITKQGEGDPNDLQFASLRNRVREFTDDLTRRPPTAPPTEPPAVPPGEVLDEEQDPNQPYQGQKIALDREESIRKFQEKQAQRAQQPRTFDSPENVDAAYEGLADRSNQRVQNIIRQQQQAEKAANPYAAQIENLEYQLSQPPIGPAQSFGAMLSEASSRRNMRRQLDSLYGRQSDIASEEGKERRSIRTATATAAENQRRGDFNERKLRADQRNSELNRQVDIAKITAAGSLSSYKAAVAQSNKDRDVMLRLAENNRKFGFNQSKEERLKYENALNRTRADFKSDTSKWAATAKELFSDDVQAQNGYVAKQQELGLPGSFFATAEGRDYTRGLKKLFIDKVVGERGPIDWLGDVLTPGNTEISQKEYDDISFKGWQMDERGLWFDSGVFSEKSGKGNYAYTDNFTDEQKFAIQRMIMRDNPEDYPQYLAAIEKAKEKLGQ